MVNVSEYAELPVEYASSVSSFVSKEQETLEQLMSTLTVTQGSLNNGNSSYLSFIRSQYAVNHNVTDSIFSAWSEGSEDQLLPPTLTPLEPYTQILDSMTTELNELINEKLPSDSISGGGLENPGLTLVDNYTETEAEGCLSGYIPSGLNVDNQYSSVPNLLVELAEEYQRSVTLNDTGTVDEDMESIITVDDVHSDVISENEENSDSDDSNLDNFTANNLTLPMRVRHALAFNDNSHLQECKIRDDSDLNYGLDQDKEIMLVEEFVLFEESDD